MTHRMGISTISAALAVSALLASASVGWAQDATSESAASAPPEGPAYAASIVIPEDETLSEADEAAMLERLATVTPDEATAAALADTPGVVSSVHLELEDGAVVYSVRVTNDAGETVDVKVDAGNAAVLDVTVGLVDGADQGDGAADEQGGGGETETGDEPAADHERAGDEDGGVAEQGDDDDQGSNDEHEGAEE
jgi:uncharacterized membrane protein YkoI